MIIAWQVTGLWLARRRQVAGAQLHVRIVSLSSVIAVVPAILLATFASVSLDRGLDRWFSTRTKRSEEHTSELQSLMRISYAVFCLKTKTTTQQTNTTKT